MEAVEDMRIYMLCGYICRSVVGPLEQVCEVRCHIRWEGGRQYERRKRGEGNDERMTCERENRGIKGE